MATIDPAALAKEIGISFTKASTVAAGDFDSYLNVVDPAIWARKEIFGAFLVLDTVGPLYDVEIELIDENIVTIIVPAGILLPLRGTRFLASTTATEILVLGGQ